MNRRFAAVALVLLALVAPCARAELKISEAFVAAAVRYHEGRPAR